MITSKAKNLWSPSLLVFSRNIIKTDTITCISSLNKRLNIYFSNVLFKLHNESFFMNRIDLSLFLLVFTVKIINFEKDILCEITGEFNIDPRYSLYSLFRRLVTLRKEGCNYWNSKQINLKAEGWAREGCEAAYRLQDNWGARWKGANVTSTYRFIISRITKLPERVTFPKMRSLESLLQ